MNIRIIGAGYGRTGTKSLQLALEALGCGPCYHMESLLRKATDVAKWEQVKIGKADWQSLFSDYRSIVDFPGCLYFEELYTRNTGAKVILTTRDEESWYHSTYNTIFSFSPGPILMLKLIFKALFTRKHQHIHRLHVYLKQTIWQEIFAGRFSDQKFAKAKYRQHIERVKQTIPAQDLLLFNPHDGWGPLCEFLNVAIPNSPFPQANKRSDFRAWMNSIIHEAIR